LRVAFPVDLAPFVEAVELYDSNRETTPFLPVDTGTHELTLEGISTPWMGYAIVTVDGGAWYANAGIPCDDGGADTTEKIWTSPIWIEEADETDDDGDGYAEVDGDCDDIDAAIHPGAVEIANAKDDDCDGDVDEGLGDDDDSAADDDDSAANDDDSAANDDDQTATDDDMDDDSVAGDDDCECRLGSARAGSGAIPFALLALLWVRRGNR